jgi:hypothetical protein
MDKTLVEAQGHLSAAYDAVGDNDLPNAIEHVVGAEVALQACWAKLHHATEHPSLSALAHEREVNKRSARSGRLGEDSIEPPTWQNPSFMRVYKVWAKPSSRSAFPWAEVEEVLDPLTQAHMGWKRYHYHKGHRRLYSEPDDAQVNALLERNRRNGNTVEMSEVDQRGRME